ncbi:sulfite exporter TauE/SafE family protein [Acuticoccus sp.]|uniref:sulfite exporter TauE/SafE family protein n=1 Tax=Acuticoccus sp. TaxID=1904378 RepID=UPI003B51A3CB
MPHWCVPSLDPLLWTAVVAIAVAGGFVKGAVGFAMPTVMMSGLGAILPLEVALAALILPTLVSNVAQSLREGFASALAAARAHVGYIVIVVIAILAAAPLVNVIPARTLYLMIGVPVVLFAALQLTGVRLVVPARRRRVAQLGLGGLAGFVGGISGMWGAPTVIYLTSLGTQKAEQMRVQGIVYLFGAVFLALGHLGSGVLNAATAPLSALLVAPALLGIALGFMLSDRLDQARFRQLTAAVLVLAGLNLVRRGLMG